jgi:hypothetical protein
VYRTVRAYRAGTLGLTVDADGQLLPTVRTAVPTPSQQRPLLALLKAVPHAYGWCRTRGSCATLAATLQATRGIIASAETMRRWLHEVAWVWKRAKLVAKDDDPHHMERLARILWVYEQLRAWGALVLAEDSISTCRPRLVVRGCPKARNWPPGPGVRISGTTHLAHSIWRPAGCSTALGHAKPTH